MRDSIAPVVCNLRGFGCRQVSHPSTPSRRVEGSLYGPGLAVHVEDPLAKSLRICARLDAYFLAQHQRITLIISQRTGPVAHARQRLHRALPRFLEERLDAVEVLEQA